MENSYKYINAKKDLELFLYEVDNLHDCLLREVSMISRGYVDKERNMWDDHGHFNARLLFHCQFPETPVIEIIFVGVELIKLDSPLELEPDGSIEDNRITFYIRRGSQDNQLIIAKKMIYRILGSEWLGPEPKTVKPIVIDDNKGQSTNIRNDRNNRK